MHEQIIATTAALLEAQGYHATRLNQILRKSGAPKGSFYYYLLVDKEELSVGKRLSSAGLTHRDKMRLVLGLLGQGANPHEVGGFEAGPTDQRTVYIGLSQ